MAISPNAYGSSREVAALEPRHASGTGDAADFTTTTRPTLAQVENWLNQISSLLNAMLAEAGFSVPVAQADARDALAFFVVEETAAMVEGVNGSGRFGPTTKSTGGRGRFALLMDDVKAFVEANKAGLERLGATRSYSATSGLGYRDSDNSGEATFPLFERKAFDDGMSGFKDWDPA